MLQPQFIEHPLIKPSKVEKREYQEDLAEKCRIENLLIILPTGLGKTVIALLTIAEFLRLQPDKKCLLLAPTRPLVYQHHKFIQNHLEIPEENVSAVTGEDDLKSRKMKWAKKVVCATPQITRGDVDRGILDLKEISLAVFDEAHRAVGNYAYTVLGSRLTSQNRGIRIIGMTASLPTGETRVKEILRSLSIPRIEVKDQRSRDVKPFVQRTGVEWVNLTLPPVVERIRGKLREALMRRLQALKGAGLVKGIESIRFTTLLGIRGKVRESGDAELWRALLSAIRLTHALNLVETQSILSLVRFLEKKFAGGGGRELAGDPHVSEAYEAARGALVLGVEHPKIKKLKESLGNLKPHEKAIVFTSYRDSVEAICSALESSSLKVGRLIGKGGKGGQSQSKQIKTLEDLRSGVSNVLVATQVGEEGLDVADCNLVVFYDNVPSAVRFVQRRGRTGRVAPGKIVVFLTKGTKDEAYYWAGRRKMKDNVKVIKKIGNRENGPLDKFVNTGKDSPTLYVDSRETPLLIENLTRLGCRVKVKLLDVGDIVASSEVVIERKTMKDFEKSIIDGRLFKQLIAMRSSYPRSVLLLQGDKKDLASIGRASFFGALASILSDFHVSIFTSSNDEETAELIFHIARREQMDKKRDVRIREGKKVSTINDTQKYVVAGIPGVNAVLADRVLKKLNSLERVFSAGEVDLKSVEGVGETLAKRIRKISSHTYNDQ